MAKANAKTKRMTRADQAKRRQDIAEFVRETGDRNGAARKFEVCLESVSRACREHGVSKAAK